jgi:hypothetical protein
MRRLIVAAALMSLAVNIIMVILVVLPRKHTRRLRHFLARVVMGLWVSTGRMWAMLHDDFWQRGNGH